MSAINTNEDVDVSTPNWPEDGEPRDCIVITVKIVCDGRGMSRKQVARLCQRFERIAVAGSRSRTVSAIC
jgi:hypothetical protein